jgi:hypothetical protein
VGRNRGPIVVRILVLVIQLVLCTFLAPIVLNRGLLSAINLATEGNFNQRYQLQFAVAHYRTYVVAVLVAPLFWLIGAIAARLLRSSRVPSLMTLLVTLLLAVGLAHLSQLPVIASFNTAVYAQVYTSIPPIAYPLLGAVIAALIVPGKRRT